jgi:predicted NBD/HSP70 family sugar kinase
MSTRQPSLRDEIVDAVRHGRASSRTELSELLGIAPSTVTTHVQALLDAGVLDQTGAAASSGGRPRTILRFGDTDGRVLAADLGGGHARVAQLDLSGRILQSSTIDLADRGDPTGTLGDIAAAMRALGTEGMRGVAMALPGPVDTEAGAMQQPARLPEWDRFPVADWLADTFGAPSAVDNDANCAALGEHRERLGTSGHSITIKAGTAIGTGIVIGGRLHRGATGAAGDITHTRVVETNGLACICGNHGCLETVASGAALARELRAAGRDAETPGDIIRLIRSGDSLATSLVRSAGSRLGDVLAGSVNLINPDAVLLTGALSTIEPFLAAVRARIYEGCHPLATQRLSIEAASLGPDAGVRGAAQLLLEQLQRA